MGLDSFKSSSTTRTSSNSTQNTDQEKQKSVEDAYKVFTADDGRKKVFQTEEDWEEAVSFIENTLNLTVEEVEEMNPTERHDILHQAIMGEEDAISRDFYPTRQCMVCDETFSFPTNWNFTRFKGEVVCNTHTVDEVLEKFRKVNELEG